MGYDRERRARRGGLKDRGPAARNAKKTHCPRGHPYSGDNLRVTNRGARYCLACRRHRRNFSEDGALMTSECNNCGGDYSADAPSVKGGCCSMECWADPAFRLSKYVGEETEVGCVEFTGYKLPSGYGRLSVNGRLEMAHRVAWELDNGPIPEGMIVLHQCDNPSCVRVEHLRLGTYADNVRDMLEKGRHNQPRGEASSASKLTRGDVVEIRERYEEGESQLSIAKDYPVKRNAIGDIVHRRTWKHVA